MRQGMFGNQMNRMKSSSKAIKRLIIINVVVFIVANLIISSSISSGGDGSGFFSNMALSSDAWIVLSKPWTLITSMFMHLDFMHILFNMLYLWMFGKILREYYGGQAVVSAYVLGALFGALMYISLFGLVVPNAQGLAIGASGGVMAIMVASAVINPNRIFNLFIIGPVKIKWIVLTLFVLTTVLNFHQNTGGKIDHFGGALFGLIYAYNLKNGKNIASRFERMLSWFARLLRIQTSSSINGKSYAFRGAMDRRPKEVREKVAKNFSDKSRAKNEMDSLLDKVKKKGYDKLSASDKERLKELSKYY